MMMIAVRIGSEGAWSAVTGRGIRRDRDRRRRRRRSRRADGGLGLGLGLGLAGYRLPEASR